MKSTEVTKERLPTPKELNIKRLLSTLNIQRLWRCESVRCFPVDFIYGYSYLIPSELWGILLFASRFTEGSF